MQPKSCLAMLPCGVLVINEQNLVIAANQVFCDWFEITEQALIANKMTMLMSPASRLLYLSHILPALQSKGLVEEKYLSLTKASGVELPILFNAHKTKFDGEESFVFTFLKMQRRHLIEEQLIIERERAVDANQQKDTANAKLKIVQQELLEKQQELLQMNQSLLALSTSDPLTGIFNRRYYDKKLDYCVQHFRRTKQPFSLILLDIDNFKLINDSYGHDIGDNVLKAVTQKLQNNLRDIDVLARVGGEEFAIILPGADFEMARITAERHRMALNAVDIVPSLVSASFGIATLNEQDTVSSIYSKADKALYQSKLKGRNCVT